MKKLVIKRIKARYAREVRTAWRKLPFLKAEGQAYIYLLRQVDTVPYSRNVFLDRAVAWREMMMKSSVWFCCPVCKDFKFSTYQGIGRCATCSFTWNRNDWWAEDMVIHTRSYEEYIAAYKQP